MLKRILLLIIITVTSIISNAQHGIDSLQNLLKRQVDPVAKLHLMLEIGDKYQQHNVDSAFSWYSRIIPKETSTSQELDEWMEVANNPTKYYVAVALARTGLILIQRGEVEMAQLNVDAAFSLALSIDQPQLALYASDNLAVGLARAKQFEQASNYFEKSLGVYRTINDTRGVVFCLGNLGVINANIGNLYKAADFFEQLLVIQEDSHSPTETLDDLMNIAALYTQLEEYEKAKNFWVKALEISNQVMSIEKSRVILTNLGALSTKLSLMEDAKNFYIQLLNAAKNEPIDRNSELIALNNISIVSYNLGQIAEAIEYWEKTLELGKARGSAQVVLDALINLSNLHYQLKQFDKSAQYHESYISVSKQLGDVGALAKSYLGIAEVQEKLNDYDKAREYYAEALKLYQQKNDNEGLANVNILIGRTFQAQQKYQQALEFYNANLEVESTLETRSLAASLQGKADVLRMQMQYNFALELYGRALPLRLELNDKNQASACLNAMGAIYEVTGNFPNAVAHYERALAIAQEIGNKEAIAAVSNNLGIVFRQLGDFQKALDSYQRALDIYIEIENEEGASYCYNNLGIIYENLGNFEKANEFYEKSLAIKQGSQDMKGLATSYMNMGNVYKFLGNHPKAEDYYNQALEISKSINDEQGRALALGSIAALKLEINDYETAIQFAKQSLEIAQAIDLKGTVKEAHRQLGWAYNATFVPEWAENEYLQVISMNHEDISRNFSILSESEKELFFRTVAEDFDRFHSFAFRRMRTNPNITQTVYNNLLKNKGLLLKSSTAMRTAIFSSNNHELILNYERWIQVRQEIARLYTLPVEQRTTDPQELERIANNLERLLVRSSTEFSDFDKSLRVEWTNIRDRLGDGEAAIEFTNFAHTRDSVLYCALVIKKDSENPLMLPLFEEKRLEKTLGSFGGNNLTYINEVYGTNSDKNTALYDLIWKPMEKELNGVSRVYVSPSGLLHKISFAAISKDLNKYLVDDFQMHLVSTTANISSSQSLTLDNSSTVSLFGGITYTTHLDARDTWKYLNGTLEETEMIKSILQGKVAQVNAATDSLATEEKFKKLSPGSQVLHIATHGFFFPDPHQIQRVIESATEYGEVEFRGGSPTFGMDNFIRNHNPLMRSGLVFAGVNDFWSGARAVKGDDGVLTALEVINIDLRKNQLVVMSACETGLGDIAGSEGVYGLQRAFKMAGTNSLIMSLWQVPDRETAEFMKIFYSSLVEMNDLQKAFRHTQSVMRQKYDPFFWAAFVLLE